MATTKKEKVQSTFEKLSAVNVNKYVEKKNNLTYLSWAYAWGETKRVCPDATYRIGETEYDESLGFMCHTEVTIEGETLEMWLPVMDGANKSMKKVNYTYTTRYGEKEVAPATTFDINKTIMRCLVKNLAMFGMGIYIYAGEDMPTTEDPKAVAVIKPAPAKESKVTKDTLDDKHVKWEALKKFCVENKVLGYKRLTDKIGLSYIISPMALNEIKNIIK
jgi:hypothetical protein|tara:strand:+ start:2543 stop:3199 length:657 start_codon:yes stop_codon:yes gene_type:complete